MMNVKILVSGFGGQGVLFSGKFLAYAGLEAGGEVSWLPSYGPEMRGGTARCGIIVSNGSIGSPIVDNPDILVALNLPSLDKFENSVTPGGHILYDSSQIVREMNGGNVHAIPAAKLAEENDLNGLANMIMTGGVLSCLEGINEDIILAAMKKTVPERKLNLFNANMRAIQLGMELAKGN